MSRPAIPRQSRGRKPKISFEYFRYDVYALQDVKFKKVLRAHGPIASAVFTELLAMIYRDKGYYLLFDRDLSDAIADSIYAKDTNEITGIIEEMVEAGLFDETIFRHKRILTSLRIQEEFMRMVTGCKRVGSIDPDLNLLDGDEEDENGKKYQFLPEKEEENIISSRNIGRNSNFFRKYPPIEEKIREDKKDNIPPNPPCGGDAEENPLDRFCAFEDSAEIFGNAGKAEDRFCASGVAKGDAAAKPEDSPDGLTPDQREVVLGWNRVFPDGDPRHLAGPPYPVNAMFTSRLHEALSQGFRPPQMQQAFETLKESPDYSWQIHAAVKPENLRMLLTERMNRQHSRDKPIPADPHADPANYGQNFFASTAERGFALCSR